MGSIRKTGLAFLAAVCLAGCGAQRYRPAPIAPAETAAKFQSRSLFDPQLRASLEKTLGRPVTPWPPKVWDLETLSIAAAYFNPTLESARARISETEAATVTAGARPNPILTLSPGIPSPYLLTLDFMFPLETAGKRRHRIDVARNIDQAARLDLADAAWTVRMTVRAAFLECIVAQRALTALRTERSARQERITILEQVVRAGELPSQALSTARIDLATTNVAIVAAQGRIELAKAALAAALSIPLAALQDIELAWPELDSPPSLDSLSPSAIQHDAVLNRIDIRRALSVYSGAEASLQLEIAKQYPNIDLGPGYTYEERDNFFTVGLSMAIPIFNHNEGPIAEADARRREAAAAFEQKQAQAIAASERALAAYAAALKELSALDTVRDIQERQAESLRQSIRAGSETRLSLSVVEVEQSLSERVRLDALARAQIALGDLENAVQRPLGPGETPAQAAPLAAAAR